MLESEFKKIQHELQKKLNHYIITLDYETSSDFVFGCFFDQHINKWKVYKNLERDTSYLRLETESEEEAFDELLHMIKVQIELEK